FGRFLPATDVPRMLAAIDPRKLAPANGSNLELGARLAAEALAQVAGVGRVVLFTDEELSQDFSNEVAIAELAKAPSGTVVHLVSRSASGGSHLEESRDDANALAPIATSTGGVFFRISGHPEDPADAASALLGLVRPIRIDGFTVEAKGLETDRLDAPEVLPEGSTLRYTAIAPRPPSEVTVTGKIWGRDYRQRVSIDPDLTRWMPALAIGVAEVEPQLSDDEVRTAALTARAVSRVTSYLAAQPTAAASTLGRELGVLYGGHLFGTSGCGCGGSFSSRCGIRVVSPPPDYEGLLRALLAPGVAACGALSGSITLEATGDEIVAVETAAATPELAACLAEVAWAARLTPTFSTHRRYEVAIAP
ncbi:MAG: putative signal peptide protein, partial [Myxococcaceae bacterium]|nr:putative signal peptide protein [Myxococcaceae bacterium]